MKLKLTFIIAFQAITTLAIGASGITGTVFEQSGPVPFATVYLTSEPTKGVMSDLNGKFQLDLEPGTYSLTVSYQGTKKEFKDITVKDGEYTVYDLDIGSSTQQIETVVVETRKITNTNAAVVNDIKEGFTVKSGLDGQSISSSGASNVGQATKQITGASVEEGKYMVVRGLGDRYSISQLNGVPLPSTDPYRNSASLDLIPAFMLDNIVTEKTFSPNQPGSFTGGNMDIRTKSFPEKLYVNIGLSASYNTISSLKSGFLTAPEGQSNLPTDLENDSLRGILDESVLPLKSLTRRGYADSAIFADKYARELSTGMLPNEMDGVSPLDHGLSFSMGNKHRKDENHIFGYVIGLKYKRSYSYYRPFGADFGTPYTDPITLDKIRESDAVYKRYLATKDNMQERFLFADEKGTINTNTGAFASLSYQLNLKNEFTFSTLYNSDIDEFAREQNGVSEQVVETNLYQARSVGTKKRSMFNTQLRGKHVNTNELGQERKMEWVAGYTRSSQFEPDLRFFSSHTLFYFDDVEDNENTRIDISSYGLPNHFFRELVDNKLDGRLDFTLPFSNRKGNQIMFGGLYSYKFRDFSEYRFKVRVAPQVQSNDGSENWGPVWDSYVNDFGFNFSRDDNGEINGFDQINYFENDTRESNFYTGSEGIYAGYGMAVVQPIARLKLVAGIRMEGTDIQVTSADTALPVGSINKLDWLPSLNVIYNLDGDGKKNGEHKLRGSISKTLARPNMRELAPFYSFDFLGGFIYTGNDTLDRTLIWNYDLSYQFYPERRPGEMFSVGVYYKNFIDPIVKVFKVTSTTGEITFANLPEAQVYGFEFEYRKRLDQLSNSLRNFTVATNLSYIYSRVAISQEEQAAARLNGLEVKEFRPFQGQSPYLVNANIFYTSDSSDITGALTFNVFGPRLYEVGVTGNPDIYELPRPTLNFNVSKTFNDKLQMRVGVNNILGARFRTSQTYRGEEYINEMYPLGRTISFGVRYQLR